VKQLADDVWHVPSLLGRWNINAYVLGDVRVDGLTRHDAKRILRRLEGHTITAHALTHAHADHQGSSKAVCEALGVPFWVGERDADAAERPELIRERLSSHPVARVFYRSFVGPGRPVDRRLREGDEVAGFRVLETPGHTRGHLAFWRDSDRTLVLGDVLTDMDPITTIPGLREPKRYFNEDSAENRRSAKRLAELEPALVLFGHGAPLRDPRKLSEFCARL
jgi:glyoxylase-like metal-dependent hydrolase (beta-lactamase superfamily II)